MLKSEKTYITTIKNINIYIEKEDNGKIYFYLNDDKININRFEILALAARENNEERAWEYMRLASLLFHPIDDPVFNTLYRCVAMDITRMNNVNEFQIHYLFDKSIHKFFNSKAQIVNIKNNPKHIPDRWVKIEDELLPVEIKLYDFDNKALKQLERYRDFYKCTRGIAVGRKASVEIPENIIFISIEELKQ